MNRDNQQSLFTLLGSMYASTLFCGINNSSSILPYVSTERTVLYRERFSGMYASWAYSAAQVCDAASFIVEYKFKATKVSFFFFPDKVLSSNSNILQ